MLDCGGLVYFGRCRLFVRVLLIGGVWSDVFIVFVWVVCLWSMDVLVIFF